MVIAGIVLAGIGGLLFAHLTILPVIHGRAALWYGREGLAATLALAGALATVWPLAVVTLPVVLLIALFVGPWIAWGARADAVASGAGVAAGMVRARFEPQDSPRTVLIGGAATLRIVPLLPGVTLMLLTGKRTPKVKLWRNVFRKQVQNHVWRVA
jgi:hypothetical protein